MTAATAALRVRLSLAAALLSIAAVPTAALPPENDAWHVRKSEHFTVLGEAAERSLSAS
jgi:hypothetical protein